MPIKTLLSFLSLGRFLNKRHSLWLRLPLGLGMGFVALFTTFEPVLAREVFHRVVRKNQLQRAARRVSFYARRSWLRLNLSQDMVYVFCNQMNLDELAALRRFLERRVAAHHSGLIACDLAYVSGSAAVEWASLPDHQTELVAALNEFRHDADKVLQAIAETPADPDIIPVEKDRETFSQDCAAAALFAFSQAMKRANCPWFILSGTFLGVVREGNFLSHDYDIDVGIMAEDMDPQSLARLLSSEAAFHCHDLEWQTIIDTAPNGQTRVRRVPVFMKVVHDNGIYIDIFVHHREDQLIWHGSSLFRWDNSAFDLANYQLAGTDLKGPADADRYLTENYGNWRVPVTEFNSALDTTNQSVVKNPLSVAIFLRRIWMAERSNPVGAMVLRRSLARQGFLVGDDASGWTASVVTFYAQVPDQTSTGTALPRRAQ